MCAPSQSQTMSGWGHLSPVPRLLGWSVCPPPPSSTAIPCSLVVAKLICYSCAPYPPPARLREIKKRTPVPRLLPCWAYDIGLGIYKKYKILGNLCPIFIRCGLAFFPAFFFQILSPPPSRGLCCFFSEHWADSDSHCNCCAPLHTHGNLTKASRGRQGNSKLIVGNKVFECTTLL